MVGKKRIKRDSDVDFGTNNVNNSNNVSPDCEIGLGILQYLANIPGVFHKSVY